MSSTSLHHCAVERLSRPRVCSQSRGLFYAIHQRDSLMPSIEPLDRGRQIWLSETTDRRLKARARGAYRTVSEHVRMLIERDLDENVGDAEINPSVSETRCDSPRGCGR